MHTSGINLFMASRHQMHISVFNLFSESGHQICISVFKLPTIILVTAAIFNCSHNLSVWFVDVYYYF